MSDAKNAYNFTGFGGNPVGTVISFFGDAAPDGYLSCDGTIYNKEDYPDLAKHLLSLSTADLFTVADDETKFRVPDLQGNFLRGTGAAPQGYGGGAAVGGRQDSTLIARAFADGTNVTIIGNTVNADAALRNTSMVWKYTGATTANRSDKDRYAIRPVNTSVLYCIKY